MKQSMLFVLLVAFHREITLVNNAFRYVFPARAGMIPVRDGGTGSGASIPRESGDDPVLRELVANALEYSPRERG